MDDSIIFCTSFTLMLLGIQRIFFEMEYLSSNLREAWQAYATRQIKPAKDRCLIII